MHSARSGYMQTHLKHLSTDNLIAKYKAIAVPKLAFIAFTSLKNSN